MVDVKMEGEGMENVWSVCRKKDTDELFVLLGSDEKYINGAASDYECFAYFCSACDKLSGNREAMRIAAKISNLVGKEMTPSCLSKCDARELWKKCTAAILNDEKYNIIIRDNTANISVEKYKNTDEYINLNDYLKKKVESGESKLGDIAKDIDFMRVKTFYVSFASSAFVRPNSFAAQVEYDKHINNEKYNINIILSQLIFEKIYTNNSGKIQLIFEVTQNALYLEELIDYINIRDLSARIYLYSDEKISPECIREMCLKSRNKCFITPLLKRSACTQDHLSRLADIYPIGNVLRA